MLSAWLTGSQDFTARTRQKSSHITVSHLLAQRQRCWAPESHLGLFANSVHFLTIKMLFKIFTSGKAQKVKYMGFSNLKKMEHGPWVMRRGKRSCPWQSKARKMGVRAEAQVYGSFLWAGGALFVEDL